jgi:hypothetical protein
MRKYQKKSSLAIVFGCVGFLLVTVPAYGYADPNTVGLLSQVLTPLLITGAACVTFLRKSIGNAFSGLWQRLRRRNDD